MVQTLRSLTEYLEWALFATGGGPPQAGARFLANDAGRELMGAHPWRWAMSGEQVYEIPEGQDWMPVPDDFLSLRSHAAGQSLTGSIRLVTAQEFTEYTASAWGGSAGHYVGMVMTEDEQEGKPANRIDLFPAAGASGNRIIHYRYRRGWRELLEDSDKVRLPAWLEGLYLEMFVAAGEGVVRPEHGTASQRWRELRGGERWRTAVKIDGNMQPVGGKLRNGGQYDHMGPRGTYGLSSKIGGPE